MVTNKEKLEAIRTGIAAIREQQHRLENSADLTEDELLNKKYEKLEDHFSTLLQIENELSDS